MPKVAIGPKTCGLQLNPAGLRELRRRRGQETWYYEAVFSESKPLTLVHYRLVPQEEEGLAGHSHAQPYGAFLGETVSTDEEARSHRLYGHREVENRTDADLLDMIENLKEGWFRAEVKAVEIPDGIEWYVREDEDGSESVHEFHRSWS